MLEFDEYKVWLNNFKPQLETLKASLGLDQAARELDLLQSQSAAPGFWDDPDKAQKTQQRIKALQDKIENQAKRERQLVRSGHPLRDGQRGGGRFPSP